MTHTQPARAPRRYDNRLREARAAQTRARIVAAGAELLRDVSIRNWSGVTIRAVARGAGVNERTVYRHFATERDLRDAVMHHLEQEAGVDLATMELEDVAEVTARILRLVSGHPSEPRPPLDPTLAAASRRQHDALLSAVSRRAPTWADADRRMAAAMLDAQWAAGTYERLLGEWDLDGDDATLAITWVIDLIRDAVARDQRPGARRRAREGQR